MMEAQLQQLEDRGRDRAVALRAILRGGWACFTCGTMACLPCGSLVPRLCLQLWR